MGSRNEKTTEKGTGVGVGRVMCPGRVSGTRVRGPAPTFAIPLGLGHGSAVLRGPRAARGLPGAGGAALRAACAFPTALSPFPGAGSSRDGPAAQEAPRAPGPLSWRRGRWCCRWRSWPCCLWLPPSMRTKWASLTGEHRGSHRVGSPVPWSGPAPVPLPFHRSLSAGGSSTSGSSSSPPWRPRRARRSSS